MHFWRMMQYHCNTCGKSLMMMLEDGCEGPGGGKEVPFTFVKDHPMAGQQGQLRFTPNGRMIQPVPFTISCPCTPRAYKQHVNWKGDEEIDITVDDTALLPRFEYDPSENPQACGIPKGHR